MSYSSVSGTSRIQPWNEAEIQRLVRETPQEERELVESALDLIQSSSTAIVLSAGISKPWRTELQRIFSMQPRLQSQVTTTIRLIFARVRDEQKRELQPHGNSHPSSTLRNYLQSPPSRVCRDVASRDSSSVCPGKPTASRRSERLQNYPHGCFCGQRPTYGPPSMFLQQRSRPRQTRNFRRVPERVAKGSSVSSGDSPKITCSY